MPETVKEDTNVTSQEICLTVSIPNFKNHFQHILNLFMLITLYQVSSLSFYCINWLPTSASAPAYTCPSHSTQYLHTAFPPPTTPPCLGCLSGELRFQVFGVKYGITTTALRQRAISCSLNVTCIIRYDLHFPAAIISILPFCQRF